ncbi:MAG: SUMF1/EgtB/PvdO family nonheme iron enzyme [Verrucomicrobiales bacterium]|nr:SUMF1/EgtB/PvdO family nonheme iron enzyme [Verrucomicrobiales bacterium]
MKLKSKPDGKEVFENLEEKGMKPKKAGQKIPVNQVKDVIQPIMHSVLVEPYTNPLGMKFVPVPGTQILMCIHETRNKDFAVFAAENRNVEDSRKNLDFELRKATYAIKNNAEHPVIKVNWGEASAFCTWLGTKDGQTYRLPTDHEWSCAVGIGDQENVDETPESKSGKIPGFPWGLAYPPPRNNLGNYLDSTVVNEGETDSTNLGAYDDGSLLTAPVMSYPANQLGIYDLGGNVWEWCQDLYKPSENWRVLRGSSWSRHSRNDLKSSNRDSVTPLARANGIGFRCVMEMDASPHTNQ